MIDHNFWDYVDQLVRGSRIEVDRSRGTASTQRGGRLYPVDYGYLAGTSAGVDVWIGGGDPERISGVICTIDLLTREAELKILLGCDDAEMRAVVEFIEEPTLGVLLVRRPQS